MGIAEAIGTTGTGVLQLVSDFTDIDGEFAIVRAMTESSGRPISFTLVESPVATSTTGRSSTTSRPPAPTASP